MKDCKCGSKMVEKKKRTPDNVSYKYYCCKKCGEEILDMKQLHEVAEKYRDMKRYSAKINRWGLSLGVRIPKDLVKKYKFKDNEEVSIVPEKKGIMIIPR